MILLRAVKRPLSGSKTAQIGVLLRCNKQTIMGSNCTVKRQNMVFRESVSPEVNGIIEVIVRLIVQGVKMTALYTKRQLADLGLVRRRSDAGRGLNGARGLLTAVILTAVIDYFTGTEEQQQDAADYFAGELYRNHMTWLDLEPSMLPKLFGAELQ